MKRREVAEKKKILKKRKKQDKYKKDEKEMWSRLKELIKEFKDISKHKTNKQTKNVKNNF